MAGVFELIKGPQRQLVGQNGKVQRADPRSLELQAAIEILAEVFGIKTSEVSEMILNRFEEPVCEGANTSDGLWPREFWLNEKEPI